MNDEPVRSPGPETADPDVSPAGESSATKRSSPAAERQESASSPAHLSGPKPQTKRQARSVPQTVEEFVNLTYQQKGQRVSLSPTLRKRLLEGPRLDDS